VLEGPSRTLAAGTVKVKGESGEGSVAMGSGEREQDRGNVFRMVGWARPSGEYGGRLMHQRSSDIPTPAYIQSATDLGVQAVQTSMQVGMVLYITARVRYVKYVITAPKYFTRYVTVM
jgi:hypothetical protein